MRKIFPLTMITLCCVAFCPRQASALNMSAPPKPEPKPKFIYKDDSGKKHSVEIVDKYQPKKIVHPFARIDSKIDPKLRRGGSERVEARGALVTPGLIDCHTHLVYAGDRAREFEMRLQGMSYEEIAKAGGGILSTVKATREATNADLRAVSSRRLEALMSEGVTTVEIKSGYGLDVENELRCLRIARSLAADHAVSIATTLLGAHAVPPEFKGRADEYVEQVCERMIPRAAAEGLASAVDGFCETIAFTRELRLWTLAESLGSVKSLFCHPPSMTHASVEPEVRRRVGIADGLIRLSVGLEDVRDLIDDLEQGLATVPARRLACAG